MAIINQSSSTSSPRQESHYRLTAPTSCAIDCNKDTPLGLSNDDAIQGLFNRVFLQPVRGNRQQVVPNIQTTEEKRQRRGTVHPVRIQRRCGISSLA
eukprot:scaffold370784_cov89-Cyclotella_meneghiniana.AAC.1